MIGLTEAILICLLSLGAGYSANTETAHDLITYARKKLDTTLLEQKIKTLEKDKEKKSEAVASLVDLLEQKRKELASLEKALAEKQPQSEDTTGEQEENIANLTTPETSEENLKDATA